MWEKRGLASNNATICVLCFTRQSLLANEEIFRGVDFLQDRIDV